MPVKEYDYAQPHFRSDEGNLMLHTKIYTLLFQSV